MPQTFLVKKQIHLKPFDHWRQKLTNTIVEGYCFLKSYFLTEKKEKLWRGWSNLPGKRWIRTLTILSRELKTKLQRQTIKAHANGPWKCTWISHKVHKWIILLPRSKIPGRKLLPQQKKSKPWKAFHSLDNKEDQPRRLYLHNSRNPETRAIM